MRSTTDPGVSYCELPPHVGTVFVEFRWIGGEFFVNGANPPRWGHAEDRAVLWGISRPPGDPTRLANDPGSLIFHAPAPIRGFFLRILAYPENSE